MACTSYIITLGILFDLESLRTVELNLSGITTQLSLSLHIFQVKQYVEGDYMYDVYAMNDTRSDWQNIQIVILSEHNEFLKLFHRSVTQQ
jgi:hypothetical protein